MANNLLTYIITAIGILVTLIAPVPISQEYRLLIISIIFLLFIAIILSNFNKKLDVQELEQLRLNEKLKIHEQLIDIKADIKSLKRGTKNEAQSRYK